MIMRRGLGHLVWVEMQLSNDCGATYGIYRKIGNLVVAVFTHFRVQDITLGTGSTKTLSGLPFTGRNCLLI
jgi:hypothetical protein